MIKAIVIGIIAALSFYYVLEPIILKSVVRLPGERSKKGIRSHYLEALRELEYELESGKIDQEEYDRLRSELEKYLEKT